MHSTEPWILTSLFSGKVYIWNYNTGDVVRQWDAAGVPIRACKFIERKQWVIVGCDDLKIRVYNYNTAEKVAFLSFFELQVTEFDGHSDYIRCIDVHPSEPLILTCGDDMSIKLWNWEQGWKNIRVWFSLLFSSSPMMVIPITSCMSNSILKIAILLLPVHWTTQLRYGVSILLLLTSHSMSIKWVLIVLIMLSREISLI